jgi:hypothetical protein
LRDYFGKGSKAVYRTLAANVLFFNRGGWMLLMFGDLVLTVIIAGP